MNTNTNRIERHTAITLALQAAYPAISAGEVNLFFDLLEDAPNWSGSPMLDITATEKAYLTMLKKKALVSTSFDSDLGCTFAYFDAPAKPFVTLHESL